MQTSDLLTPTDAMYFESEIVRIRKLAEDQAESFPFATPPEVVDSGCAHVTERRQGTDWTFPMLALVASFAYTLIEIRGACQHALTLSARKATTAVQVVLEKIVLMSGGRAFYYHPLELLPGQWITTAIDTNGNTHAIEPVFVTTVMARVGIPPV